MIQITRIDGRQAGGMWVSGTVGEYRFQALVFHQHSEYELNGSRISKLGIQHDGRIVFNWDRGADIEPPTVEVEDLVVRLCSELASMVCFQPGDRICLLEMDDPDPVPVGSLGTVTAVHYQSEWLQIEVDWDSGRTLMLSVPPDRVEHDLNDTSR